MAQVIARCPRCERESKYDIPFPEKLSPVSFVVQCKADFDVPADELAQIKGCSAEFVIKTFIDIRVEVYSIGVRQLNPELMEKP